MSMKINKFLKYKLTFILLLLCSFKIILSEDIYSASKFQGTGTSLNNNQIFSITKTSDITTTSISVQLW